MLKLVNALCKRLRCVAFHYWASRLKNDVTFIVMFVNIMNSNTGFYFTRIDNGFMNILSIHTLATVFRQQGWMHINNTAGICLNQNLWNLPQKTSKHDQIGTGFLKFW